MNRTLIMIAIGWICCSPLMLQTQTAFTESTFKVDEIAKPATAELEKFNSLVGRWVGTGLSGGWEEKDGMVKFPLIKEEDSAASYGGLMYKLVCPNELHVWVAMRNPPTNQADDAALVFKRVGLPD